jgi:hypothetical protein
MSDEIILELLERAPFSFVGTIEHLEAATMDVPVDERTAIVYVDRVMHAPATMLGLDGERITLQLLKDVEPPQVGETTAFFAQTVAFGKSVVVAEVGRLCLSEVESHLRGAAQTNERAFATLERLLDTKRLLAHANAADAVVLGNVVKLERLPVAPDKPPSEHDPDWWVATILVQHVERGEVGPGEVRVLYANSLDMQWRDAPKPKAGEEALWLLHRSEGEAEQWAPYQMLDAKDRQPVQTLEAIRPH